MDRNLSIYLDFVRFAAAMLVYLGHASNGPISGGLLWQLYPYLHSAVIVFFVLSGYVIGYVVDTKESTSKAYIASRFSRMYSVVIPALLITAAFDLMGLQIDYQSYTTIFPFVDDHEPQNYLLSLFFVQNIWGLGFNPGTNGPFWSLSYEVFYYVLFGVAIFIRSRIKYLFLIVILLIAGPSIISLFPIWLMGYAVYRLHKKPIEINKVFAISLSITSILLLIIFVPWLNNNLIMDIKYFREDMLTSYIVATCFSVHILLVPHLLKNFKISNRLEKYIRWCASLTFVIYLFHYPIIRFLALVSPFEKATYAHWAILYIISFFIMVVSTPATEKLRIWIKGKLNAQKNRSMYEKQVIPPKQ